MDRSVEANLDVLDVGHLERLIVVSRPWVRMQIELLGDPRLQRAARHGAKRLDLLLWIILFAARADDGGRLTVGNEPAEPEDIARHLPAVSAEEVAEALRSLEMTGILVRDPDGVLRLDDWERWWAYRPSETKEAQKRRQRLSRSRKRAATTTDVTTAVTTGHDVTVLDVTLQKQNKKENTEEQEHIGKVPAATAHAAARAVSHPLATSAELQLTNEARELLSHVPAGRRVEVEGEMVAVLTAGHRFRNSLVRATPERLAAKCRETLKAHAGTPRDNVWAYCLTKLADNSDVVEARNTAQRAAIEADEREFVRRGALADEWAAQNPSDAQGLMSLIEKEIPSSGLFGTMARRQLFVARACQRIEDVRQ